MTLVALNRFVQQWIRDKFAQRIEELARSITSAASNSSSRLLKRRRWRTCPCQGQLAAGAKPSSREVSRLNPTFTFDTFVTGKANEFARAAATQVAERPGAAYNPLFIYGGVGLGKTHLIQAIGNRLRAHAPDEDPLHPCRAIRSDVVRAYQHKAFDDFKRYYHSLDLLLIDDIQFFSGKSRTQEEFFYAFNALIEAHKQVVITCDTYPKEISGMERPADLALRLGSHRRSRAARARNARGDPAEEGEAVGVRSTKRWRSSSRSTSSRTCASSKAG